MELYDNLGVSKEATPEEIKKAYRDQSKIHHPDKGGDAAEFRKVQRAYDLLSDSEKRSRYDRGEDMDSVESGVDPVVNILANLFTQVLQVTDPDTTDIFKEMRKSLNNTLIELKKQIEKSKKVINKLEKVKARIKVDVESIFAQTIHAQQQALTLQITKTESDMALGQKALDRLKGCEYSADQKPHFQSPGGAMYTPPPSDYTVKW